MECFAILVVVSFLWNKITYSTTLSIILSSLVVGILASLDFGAFER